MGQWQVRFTFLAAAAAYCAYPLEEIGPHAAYNAIALDGHSSAEDATDGRFGG